MFRPPFDVDSEIRSYSNEVRKARYMARLVAILHSFSRFLAFCDLTWATVALLGAFVSNLHLTDYFAVSTLLVLEAARLATAALFSQFQTRSPDYSHPFQVQYSFTDDPFLQESITGDRHLFFPRLLSPILQLCLIVPGISFSFWRLIRLPHLHHYDDLDNLQLSLRTFYSLVIISIVVSFLALVCSVVAWIWLRNPSDQNNVLRYYDEVLQNALVTGVIQADSFNFFQFAFRMLSRDYARYAGWPVVVQYHRRMLRYIYAHKQGADNLQICLDSEDASVRQAAANVVGVWADAKRGLKLQKVELPPELLAKLADMVGRGEVGWAATNSFGALAKRNPQILLQTLTGSNRPVLYRIVELVDGRSERSLASVRTLVHFFMSFNAKQSGSSEFQSREVTGPLLPKELEDQLVANLKELLKESGYLQRLRVHAAYLLLLLGKLDHNCYSSVRDIDPSKDGYWYAMEQTMLKLLLERETKTGELKFPEWEHWEESNWEESNLKVVWNFCMEAKSEKRLPGRPMNGDIHGETLDGRHGHSHRVSWPRNVYPDEEEVLASPFVGSPSASE